MKRPRVRLRASTADATDYGRRQDAGLFAQLGQLGKNGGAASWGKAAA